MLINDMQSFANEGKMSKQFRAKYLSTYVWPLPDWERHIVQLANRIKRKVNENQVNSTIKNDISFAILAPYIDKSIRISADNPENFLFYVQSFHQKSKHDDWVAKLQEIVAEDIEIIGNRNQVASLGIVEPIEYQPFTRQAFNWLYEKASEEGYLTDESKKGLQDKFKKLVWAYGGMVISNVFQKYSNHLDSITNWHSGYFFEKVIYDIYSVDQIAKIKRGELEKTSTRLVKRVRADG